MKRKINSRVFSIVTTVILIMTCLIGPISYRAYAAYQGPEILITEIMPMSQSQDDAYEYIELYNNSDGALDLKDYKLPYQHIDITISKVIQPRGIMVVCTRSNVTLEAFNRFYGTSLTENNYTTLPLSSELMSNSSGQKVLLSGDDGLVVSRVSYEKDDIDIKKGVTYKYPSSGFDMRKLASKQAPTPGSVESVQIPGSGLKVTGITLDKDYMTMELGQTARLYATVTPATATNKSIQWISGDTGVVQVDQNGALTAKKEGMAVITARTVDGGYTAFCTVFVNRIAVTGVSLNKISLKLNAGQSVILFASISPMDATNKKVIWSSSNSSVAGVDPYGTVTGKSRGTAVIKVKTVDGNYTASCSVQVDDSTSVRVTGVTLDKANVTVEKGKVIVLEAVVKPYNADNKKVLWSSDNSEIASVDESGIIYARKEGTAIITVKTVDGGYKASCSVTVEDDMDYSENVTGLMLNKEFILIKAGNSHKLIPKFTPRNVKGLEIVWNTDKGSVAKVTQDGLVTGINEGYATITVSTKDGKYSAKCTVHVIKHDNGKSKWK